MASNGSKRVRPWDKIRAQPLSDKATKVGRDSQSLEDVPPVEVPRIAIDGVEFLSDRFYLNKTIYDDGIATSASPGGVGLYATATSCTNACRCGARCPPPLFDRSRLVAQLNLKAAILVSYTVQPSWLAKEFPTLLGPHANVPTLVLHGKKGLIADPIHGGAKKYKIPTKDEQDDSSFTSQDEEESPRDEAVQNCPAPPPVAKATFSSTRNAAEKSYSERAFWTQVQNAFIPSQHIPRSRTAWLAEDGCSLNPSLIEHRVYRRGVHHPKFMILLERSGDVVVVVSTSNLTEPRATDASWLQRFPAARSSRERKLKEEEDDFGIVLTNMLEAQTLSCRKGHVTPMGFCRQELGWNSLRDLTKHFDFSKAQVHLVATIPGDRLSKTASPSELFGRQRVSAVMKRLSQGPTPRLPPILRSEDDRLIVQPTSLGSEWTRANMTEVVRSYLGHEDRDVSKVRDAQVFPRLDILWPTERFMKAYRTGFAGRGSPASVVCIGDAFDTKELVLFKENEGYLFLSSDTFSKIDLSCLSRMAQYEVSVPLQRSCLPPHIKSICRLFQGNDYRLRQDYGLPKSEEIFSYFLLTSACLSRGAQGETLTQLGSRETVVSYANFELGVLFTSRLQGRASDRVYGWKPAQCMCRNRPRTSLIHLPVPFSLRPARYQSDRDDVEFCETPYFHEIALGTACVGNMKLTPYGSAIANQQESKRIDIP
ncbi:predicted protein [Phaeodactylum tricornutum CCAP 1055/1]|uniref:Tyrosyl-DNA phosphodiesterase n=1 Tax=Phaeodactylum tricornutum (strain CCAP 1055/1) TaxID=556484 RepID=B7FX81_PHATC|nr:predicted protein [Phaeodactylum tricornutum CCAP 1055/1]EEC49115.1 predicted protein [Phaeodactylum tricornutum CCAP 1055/1]|eukprot:XP_002179292.1 predicted protein [Phaeodactylum tricornutum CCAP 1055/1]